MKLMTLREFQLALKDPYWRIRNLYWVSDKEGKPVLFRPWPEQEKFYKEMWYRNVVPKARQRGFSTAVQIMMLDAAIFVPNTACAVIAQDETTALQIFEKKIKFAWNRLPVYVREVVAPLKFNTKHELVMEHGSSMLVSTSTRGTTLQYLHVSEYGKICEKDPVHADEIMEGSLPSVDSSGVIVIESTVETPYGHFSNMVRVAEKHQQTARQLTKLDYKLHFASWWDAPEYELDPALVVISPKDQAYFYRLEATLKRDISPAKRAWYVTMRDSTFGGEDEKMFRQYPSTLDEAFSVSSEGLWLSKQLARARREKRISKLPFLPGIPVNTFWDLGVDDDNSIWFHQFYGPWDHWINYAEASGEPYSYSVGQMQELQAKFGYVWGTHHLPHDGNQRRPGAESLKTPQDMLEDLGLSNIVIVPRIAETSLGIMQLREDFNNYRFDEENCAEGLKHLDGFSKTWNARMSLWNAEIAKNGHQHAADAIRQKAQVAHLLKGDDEPAPTRPKKLRNRSGMAS
ncbi:hypothetical protein HB778_30360 [Mesorhizobium huakuii]|uniref:Terminase n=2 Tax=Mesorhizobium huakuii TaxID=28104 RepID=A0A7G6T3Y1_9HYPH|nr:hypothetical protein HB778_30360 [Mesorhizobium huakuii]